MIFSKIVLVIVILVNVVHARDIRNSDLEAIEIKRNKYGNYDVNDTDGYDGRRGGEKGSGSVDGNNNGGYQVVSYERDKRKAKRRDIDLHNLKKKGHGNSDGYSEYNFDHGERKKGKESEGYENDDMQGKAYGIVTIKDTKGNGATNRRYRRNSGNGFDPGEIGGFIILSHEIKSNDKGGIGIGDPHYNGGIHGGYDSDGGAVYKNDGRGNNFAGGVNDGGKRSIEPVAGGKNNITTNNGNKPQNFNNVKHTPPSVKPNGNEIRNVNPPISVSINAKHPGQFQPINGPINGVGHTGTFVGARPITTNNIARPQSHHGQVTNNGNVINGKINPLPIHSLGIVKTNTGPVKTSAVPVKTSAVPIKTSAGPIKTSAGPIKTSAGPIKTSAGPIKTSAGPIKTSAGPIKTSAGPIKTARPIKTLAEPIKTSVGPIKTSARPDKTSVGPIKTSAGPIKTTAEPIKTNAGPIKTNAGPIKTNAGPIKISAEPIKTNAGPIKTIVEPVKTLAGPTKISAEPIKTSAEPIKTSAEPIKANIEPSKTNIGPVKPNNEPAKSQTWNSNRNNEDQTPSNNRPANGKDGNADGGKNINPVVTPGIEINNSQNGDKTKSKTPLTSGNNGPIIVQNVDVKQIVGPPVAAKVNPTDTEHKTKSQNESAGGKKDDGSVKENKTDEPIASRKGNNSTSNESQAKAITETESSQNNGKINLEPVLLPKSNITTKSEDNFKKSSSGPSKSEKVSTTAGKRNIGSIIGSKGNSTRITDVVGGLLSSENSEKANNGRRHVGATIGGKPTNIAGNGSNGRRHIGSVIGRKNNNASSNVNIEIGNTKRNIGSTIGDKTTDAIKTQSGLLFHGKRNIGSVIGSKSTVLPGGGQQTQANLKVHNQPSSGSHPKPHQDSSEEVPLFDILSFR